MLLDELKLPQFSEFASRETLMNTPTRCINIHIYKRNYFGGSVWLIRPYRKYDWFLIRGPWSAMKSLQSREYNWFSWVMKLSYILDRYISWPLKRQLQPSMYFMGDDSSNGPWNSREGTIKNPWKCPTHTSTKVDINALEKCCTHLLISNSSCQICLNLGQ